MPAAGREQACQLPAWACSEATTADVLPGLAFAQAWVLIDLDATVARVGGEDGRAGRVDCDATQLRELVILGLLTVLALAFACTRGGW